MVGVFVGSLTYYFISEKYSKRLKRKNKEINAILDLLSIEQRKILRVLIENNGRLAQSKLAKKTGLSRVKISRELKKLEQKKVIEKVKSGMTNTVILDDKFEDLLG
jgi:uncharacterized membrane protein